MNSQEFEEQVDVTKAMIKLRLKKAGKQMSNRNINRMARKLRKKTAEELQAAAHKKTLDTISKFRKASRP